MTDVERIEQRLSAVERTLTGEIDIDAEALQDVLALSAEVEALEERIGDLEERIADVEGEVEAVGGYLSEVDSVNEEVERQALSAMATVDRLDDRVDDEIGNVEPIEVDTFAGFPMVVPAGKAGTGDPKHSGRIDNDVPTEEWDFTGPGWDDHDPDADC